jgi:arsenical pump membrane protein
MAHRSGGWPRRLLRQAFAAASAITAVLSLDATVVLLTPSDAGPLDADAAGTPVFALVTVAATLAGFVVSSAAGLNPAWAAGVGAAVLAGPALAQRRTTAATIGRSAAVPFLLSCLA